jgi:hypothetical protein
MLHTVFDAIPVALGGIPPVVLGDKFLFGTAKYCGRFTGNLDSQTVPLPCPSPRIP